MKNLLSSSIGRLRLVSIIEGISLIVLVLIAVPLKYSYDDPSWVKTIGPIHGALFVLFAILTLMEAYDKKWKLKTTAMVFLIASFIPFGCFYVDNKILKPMED